MSQKVFIQVFIKSKMDLPKGDEKYFMHTIGDSNLRFCSLESATFHQIKRHIDYYLQEKELPTEEEIKKEAPNYYFGTHILSWIDGVNWLMSKLKT